MFLSVDEAVRWIMSQRNAEHGFQSFKSYLNATENHLDHLNIIHVAGTNGKGSTTAMLMSCLMEAGYKVGTFTSPHLLMHEDRIRINNVQIPAYDFLRICNQKKEVWEQYHLSMFEMDLDLASVWFEENAVDVVILEAGLGGRLDSTNVIESSLASVIVSIGLDHMDRLGDSVEKIAFEKAGIIKENGLVICGEHKKECKAVIEAETKMRHAELIEVSGAKLLSQSPIVFEYQQLRIELSEKALYQVHNASCAIETLLQLKERHVLSISEDEIIQGLKKAHWAGRFDVVCDVPLTIVDGAHNVHGMRALKESAQGLKRPLVCVFACLKDKDKQEMICMLQSCCDELILTEFDFYRAMKVSDFEASEEVLKISDWKQAIALAQSKAAQGTVLITGSLYFISEVMTYFKAQKNTDSV